MIPQKTRIIKRYQNRKLYDTEDSCYVTLEEIGDMVKDGQELRVIDNKTGDDLTTITLTQIIFEEEKKKKSLMPLEMLKKIIRSPGQQAVDFVQKSINHGVKSISSVKGEAEKVIQKVRHEIEDSGSFMKDIFSRSNILIDELQTKVEEKLGVSSGQALDNVKSELRSLREKLATLERRVRGK